MKQYATGRPGEVSLPGDMRLRTNIFHNVILDVNAPSSRVTAFPSDLYGFVTIFNNTRFDFILIKGVVDNPLEIIGACPAYTLLTFPIDRSISNVFIRWDGTAGITERCKIFFTEENLGLVGQFRPPAISPAQTVQIVRENFGTRLFAGVLTASVIFTADRSTDIKSFYLTNTLTTAGTVTIVHRRPGFTDINLVSGLSISGNMTFSLGYISLLAGDSFVVTNVTGTIHGLIYGAV